MFTLCILMYSGLLTPRPVSTACTKFSNTDRMAVVDQAIEKCRTMEKDPFLTCSVRPEGTTKVIVTVRKLDGV